MDGGFSAPDTWRPLVRGSLLLPLLLTWGYLGLALWLGRGPVRAWLLARARTAARLLGLVLLLGLLASLPLQAAMVGEGWRSAFDLPLWQLYLTTSVGRVWYWQLPLGGLLALWLLSGTPERRPRIAWALAGVLLVSLAVGGHAGSAPGWRGQAQAANQSVHLLAVGAWLGSLPGVLLCLGKQPVERRIAINALLRRYSLAGHLVVALVLVTGALAVGGILGLSGLTGGSHYADLLLIKIALALTMVGLALLNRYVLVPSLSRMPKALRSLVRFTALEIGLGLGALLLAVVFAGLDPGA